MSRFALAPEAAADLVGIWRYIRDASSEEMADRVEMTIRRAFIDIAKAPGIGHKRTDLTLAQVLFLPVYSYLIVYRTQGNQIQIVAILHGNRDLKRLLKKRI